MNVIDHIQYLICRHDCVVVAGLGAFVSQYVPAHFAPGGMTLLPPSRSLVFNNVISHDDGLLVGSVARREGIPYEEARALVDREVETIIGRIDLEGGVDLPRIGRLERAGSNAFAFTPAIDNPIVNIRYAALPEIAVAASGAASPEPDESFMLDVEVSTSRRWSHRILAAAKYAAAVVILVAVGATLSTPVILDRKVDHASLAPVIKPAKHVVLPAPANPSPVAADSATAAPTEKPASLETAKPILAVTDLTDNKVPEGYDCYIIVASCSTSAEARRYVATHGGARKLGIISAEGRHRVYAAVAGDYDQAFDFKTNDPAFSTRYPSAWVFDANATR